MQIFGFCPPALPEIVIFFAKGDINPLSHGLRRASSPERGSFISADRQIAKSSPFGGAGERSEPERVRPRSAALSQKAALQLPLAVTTPPVKRRFWKIRRFSRIAKL